MKNLAAVFAVALGACDGGGTNQHLDGLDAYVPPAVTTIDGCNAEHVTVVHNDDGTKVETGTKYLIATDVHRGMHFTTEVCRRRAEVDCPPGLTCAQSGAILPDGDVCAVSTDTGTFFGGSLVVVCGVRTRAYNAQGTVVSETQYPTTTAKVTY